MSFHLRPSTPSVVITGIGAVTPLGLDRTSTWQGMLAGRSGVGPITAFDASDIPVRIAAEVKGFDAETVLEPKRLRRSARFTHLAVAAAREAVADAGLAIGSDAAGRRDGAGLHDETGQRDGAGLGDGAVDPDRVGVVINAAAAGFDTIEWATRQMIGLEPNRVGPHFVSSSLANMPACEVAIDLGIHGPVTASALACASGAYAVLEARRLVLGGEADVVVCGGTDAAITPVMFAGLTTMGALSRRNEDPAGASRPFAADRDGFVFGEGAVVLVVESAEHAARRGAAPYANVAGGALTADAFHVSAPEPDGHFAAAAIRRALASAGIESEEVDYVCAHGTGTRANDRTETRAIRSAYGKAAESLAVSSPKSMVGHLIGAAGALGVMVDAFAIRDGIVPPTTNLWHQDPDCDLDYVPNVARRMPVHVATTNAFGFGGQNCVVVLTAPG